MLKEETIPINGDLRIVGISSIVIGQYDVANTYYLSIDGVPNVRVFIFFNNFYDLSEGTFRILRKRESCPSYVIQVVTRFIEENHVLFKDYIRKLAGGDANGI